jgi:hypothetical protein
MLMEILFFLLLLIFSTGISLSRFHRLLNNTTCFSSAKWIIAFSCGGIACKTVSAGFYIFLKHINNENKVNPDK